LGGKVAGETEVLRLLLRGGRLPVGTGSVAKSPPCGGSPTPPPPQEAEPCPEIRSLTDQRSRRVDAASSPGRSHDPGTQLLTSGGHRALFQSTMPYMKSAESKIHPTGKPQVSKKRGKYPVGRRVFDGEKRPTLFDCGHSGGSVGWPKVFSQNTFQRILH
jgi:hypothetical protein